MRAGMASGVAQGIQAGGLGGLHSAAAGLASLAGAGAAHVQLQAGDLDPSTCWRAPCCLIITTQRVHRGWSTVHRKDLAKVVMSILMGVPNGYILP